MSGSGVAACLEAQQVICSHSFLPFLVQSLPLPSLCSKVRCDAMRSPAFASLVFYSQIWPLSRTSQISQFRDETRIHFPSGIGIRGHVVRRQSSAAGRFFSCSRGLCHRWFVRSSETIAEIRRTMIRNPITRL